MYFLEINKKTLLVKMKEFFPECEFLISDQEQLFPFRCLQDHCPRNSNCMEKLAKRVKHIFDQFENAELLVLYFKYRDHPTRLRAGVFWRDLREPRFITMNPYAWEKFKEIGTVYSYTLPDELFLGGTAQPDLRSLSATS